MTTTVHRALAAAAVLAAATLGACSLDVSTPDVVRPESVDGPEGLPTRLAGAVGDFTIAYAGFGNGNAGDGLALASGLMADEFIATDYFDTHYQLDTRNVVPSNGTNGAVLRNLQRALVSAQGTADAYAAEGLDDDAGRARALTLVGFSYTLIAESYCSGVPFSIINPDGTFAFGPSRTTTEMLTLAVRRFEEAAAVAAVAGDVVQYHAAYVGMGRAMLDMGQFANASAAVVGVPARFFFGTEQGIVDDRVKNGIHELTYVNTRYTVADGEGVNGLPFVRSGDPRTATVNLGASAFDQGTPLHAPLKYASYQSPVPIATGTEASLIRAEAALQANNYAGASGTLEMLNALRSAASMPLLAAAATPAAQVDQLFAERAFWLFGTAHRLGDLRRLVRQYGRAAGDVFPTGAYFKGGSYGVQVSLMVPQEEGENPNYDPTACVPTQP